MTGVGSGLSLAKEVRTVSNATWATNVATLTTGAAHGLAVGARIRVAGVSPSGYNGFYVTTTGTTGSTIKYAKTSDPGAFSSAGVVYSVGMTATPTRVLQMLSESLDLDVA